MTDDDSPIKITDKQWARALQTRRLLRAAGFDVSDENYRRNVEDYYATRQDMLVPCVFMRAKREGRSDRDVFDEWCRFTEGAMRSGKPSSETMKQLIEEFFADELKELDARGRS